LPEPGRAGQHHPAVRLRHLVQLDFSSADAALSPIISVPRTSCRRSSRVLAAQARGFHRAADHHQKLVDVEGLLDEVVGALLDRRDRDLDIAVARDDDHRHIRVVALHRGLRMSIPSMLLSFSQISRIISPGRPCSARPCLVGRARQPRRKALVFKDIADQFADIAFVVDNQNIAHARSTLLPGFRRPCPKPQRQVMPPWPRDARLLEGLGIHQRPACRHVPR
jgi:hypothetical protein